MNRLAPQDLPGFLRKYRLPGSRVRRVRVLYPRPREVAVEFTVSVREAIKQLGTDPQVVRLRLRLEGVDEFRVQMRPGMPKSKVADARLSYLNGLFYVSLDSVGPEPNEVAQIFDFRISEQYAAGRELFWEEMKKPGAPPEPTE